MAGGGQKGVGGIEFAGGAMILLGFIGGCTARGWVDGQDDNPAANYEAKCEQAYYDSKDADPDNDENVAILDVPDCQVHMSTVRAAQAADNADQIQEAQP